MPLTGSVQDRIRTLYHEDRAGTASRKRSRAQKIAIAFATKRREKKRRR
jgi:hypothetical protein